MIQRSEKGQTLVIGFILILGLLVAVLGWFQVTQLPEISRQTEIDHMQTVETDMSEVNTGIWEVTSDEDRVLYQTNIDTIVDYPFFQSTKRDFSRAGLRFDPVADSYQFTNTNRTASEEDTGITNTRITYEPTFFVREPTDVILENAAVARSIGSTSEPLAGQLLVQSDKIYLTQVNIDANVVSKEDPTLTIGEVSRNEYDIKRDGGSQIVLEGSTKLSEDFWEDRFGNVDTVDGSAAGDDGVDVSGGTLQLKLAEDEYTVVESIVTATLD